MRSETALVSELLAGIFVEDAPQPVKPVAKRASPIKGLDADHALLLIELFKCSPVERGRFETLVRDRGLLPDGALETINGWAFDQFDQALLEDGEQILVVDHLKQRIDGEMEAVP